MKKADNFCSGRSSIMKSSVLYKELKIFLIKKHVLTGLEMQWVDWSKIEHAELKLLASYPGFSSFLPTAG